jgi:hypothetical protein
MTFAELVHAGGPEALARAAAKRAAQAERRFWLEQLERLPPEPDNMLLFCYVHELRRKLGIPAPKTPKDMDLIRRQTRDRVRRFRERQRADKAAHVSS